MEKENNIENLVKRGNVVINEDGRKKVISKTRVLKDGEKFYSKRAHEDGDFSYMCLGEYCRCCQ
jgi:hypothetical protein